MFTFKLGNWSFGFGTYMNNGHDEKRPLALIILDGWGYSPKREGNAIALAHTPVYDEICGRYPKTNLSAAGLRVGLSPDTAGNAEVGHLNIGAGRIVQTDVSRIAESIKNGSFFDNTVLKNAFARARANDSAVHLIGLLSDGDVHAKPETLFALLRMAKNENIKDVFVHAILDGRDVPPRTADVYAEALEIKIADIGVGRSPHCAGVITRWTARPELGTHGARYTMLVHAEGERAFDAVSAIRGSFLRGIADEFIRRSFWKKNRAKPVATIKNGDVVIFFNHRAGAMRQLVKSLAVRDASDFAVFGKPKIETVCLTEYDRSLICRSLFVLNRKTTFWRRFSPKTAF
jgi:2,3-bisphosphoglycerate-independent phosphoglycerate mutase